MTPNDQTSAYLPSFAEFIFINLLFPTDYLEILFLTFTIKSSSKLVVLLSLRATRCNSGAVNAKVEVNSSRSLSISSKNK